MSVLRTIAIIIIVAYAIRFLAKLFAPMLIRYAAKKAGQKFTERFNQQTANRGTHKEGETIVGKAPKRKPSKKVGEYIDYEEID